MGIDREESRVRHRKFALGGGGNVEVWLESNTSSVTFFHEHHDDPSGTGGRGMSTWERCGEPACLGVRLPSHEACLLHSDSSTRLECYRAVLGERSALQLNGIVLTEQLWLEILDHLTQGGTCTAQIICVGTVFPFPLSLEGLKFTKGLSLDGSTLEHGGHVRSTQFIVLSCRYVDFNNATMVFEDCQFEKELAIAWSHTEQHVAFLRCRVRGDADMVGFSGELHIDDTQIDGSLNVIGGAMRFLILRNVNVRRQIETRRLEADTLIANGTTFDAATSLESFTANTADFSHTRFLTRPRLIMSGSHLNLRHTTWERGGILEVENARIDLDGAVGDGPISLIGRGGATVVSIAGADAGLFSLSHVGLTRCVFNTALRLHEMSLDSTVVLPTAPTAFARRRCVADEFAWRRRHTKLLRRLWRIAGTTLDTNTPGSDIVLPDLTAAQVAGVYRSLRKALETAGNEPGASDFYYGEMEMRRVDSSTSIAERAVITLYWILAGYGLRASRAFTWFLACALLGALVFSRWGFQRTRVPFTKALLSALESAIPGIGPHGMLSGWGRATNIALTLLGPVLLGLGVLAMRNRVKR